MTQSSLMKANNIVMAAWHDTKRVTALSTIHTDNTSGKMIKSKDGGAKEVEKPVLLESYNQHTSGVDIMDQNLGTYSYPHESTKWHAPTVP